MRPLLIAMVLFASLAGPALAQPSLFTQAQSARQIFALGLDDGGLLDGSYYDLLTQGLDGQWANTTYLLAPGDGEARFAELTARSCTTLPTTIAVRRPLTIVLTSGRPPDQMFDVTYVYQGGTGFSAQADTTAFLRRLGILDARDAMRSSQILALGNVNADVSIFRPYEDVLVITRLRGLSEVYVRCAGGAASQPVPAAVAPAPEEGVTDPVDLETALGDLFDEQFRSADPEVRAQFIACATALFGRLSAPDLELAITSRFNPPDRDRFETAYPGLTEGAQACGESAAAAGENGLP